MKTINTTVELIIVSVLKNRLHSLETLIKDNNLTDFDRVRATAEITDINLALEAL